MSERKSYADSLRVLEAEYSSCVSEADGVEFFRTFVGDGDDLGGLTLPRTFFGRSEIHDCSFANTDLSDSEMNWNDFISVDFTDAILSNCDMRASVYQQVKFVRADLKGADLRHSSFEDCDFSEAELACVRVTQDQVAAMGLSREQMDAVEVVAEPGPEPEGG